MAFAPSLADILFTAVLLWLALFTINSDGTAGLLVDSQTGYHIRAGDWILANRAVPRADIFSFSKAGEPWFAWEWLSAAMLSAVHSWLGLRGVVVLSAGIIALAIVTALRHMVWRGANALAAIVVMHLVVAASSIHFLARPHIWTLLFAAAALWAIDADRRAPSRRIWRLVPLTALWANLHGGFLMLPACLAIVAVGSALERSVGQAKRYALVAAACAAASGINPYGFAMHAHAIPYLRAAWIRELVQEFQSPNFQAPETLYFEVLLLAGVAVVVRLAAARDYCSALLILAWGHAALTSVRHIPIYALVCAPLVAREATLLWDWWAAGAKRSSVAGILDSLSADHTPGLRRVTAWPAVAIAALALAPAGLSWPADFPAGAYPAGMVRKHAELVSGSRIFTTDRWADYLTYHFYPRQRIFIDGRSDFFGPEISSDYIRILKGHHGWDRLLARYDLNAALVPAESALASLLRVNAGWTLVEEDGQAALFQRNR